MLTDNKVQIGYCCLCGKPCGPRIKNAEQAHFSCAFRQMENEYLAEMQARTRQMMQQAGRMAKQMGMSSNELPRF